MSSVAILGGAAFASCSPAEAASAFGDALERGVNHLDIAPRYGDAELLVGPHVPSVRPSLFVADKTTRRNPDGVRAQLEESLARLGIDQLDLYQMHAVTSLSELDSRASAAEAIFRARDEGLCRFVGITGHDLGAPAAFAEALRRYDLDTVMFPVYPALWASGAYRADAESLLASCIERDVGVMAIKAAAWRPWGSGSRSATTWYEPQPSPSQVAAGVRFALSTPGVHCFCTPGDLDVLAVALDAAEAFEPMSASEWDEAIDAASADPLIFPMPA